MTWEVTQWERSDLARERARERKAAIMWRVKASAVEGAEEATTEGGIELRGANCKLCSLPVETRAEMEGEMGRYAAFPHSLLHQSPRTGDVKLLHKHSRKPLRGHSTLLVRRGIEYGETPPSWYMRLFIRGPL